MATQRKAKASLLDLIFLVDMISFSSLVGARPLPWTSSISSSAPGTGASGSDTAASSGTPTSWGGSGGSSFASASPGIKVSGSWAPGNAGEVSDTGTKANSSGFSSSSSGSSAMAGFGALECQCPEVAVAVLTTAPLALELATQAMEVTSFDASQRWWNIYPDRTSRMRNGPKGSEAVDSTLSRASANNNWGVETPAMESTVERPTPAAAQMSMSSRAQPTGVKREKDRGTINTLLDKLD
ncbi:hypothetical protein KXW65_006908 [Aspergillus fumigatus]|uniref:Uncharacterized protein n=1 Tax=Aspergillus fumigatus TaxID=746128 RepID=A0A8H4HKJ4_ASPFM|nr:hypothetical protein CNMCM8057_006274 [Aspergillus fumigatus]KAF4253734.1 hypothetical protein CNMCM8714_005923 [Aspergillus fumigatus]KAF4255431.1 hypothetical protein CNMCM8812_007599 [Aspergillus fumigatus]KAF4294490.1 hypothetical protein CNMCM8686_003192 [Aspergillus fumigatus]KAH1341895.1 hypothetical protein KXX67_006940 [Aspergillus fumigatus]